MHVTEIAPGHGSRGVRHNALALIPLVLFFASAGGHYDQRGKG